MRLVLRREKRRLVMVEPPGQALRRAVLEIDDCVLVPVEHRLVEERAGRVQKRRVRNLRRGVFVRAIEAREDGGRGDAVETLAVVEESKSHPLSDSLEFFTSKSWQ